MKPTMKLLNDHLHNQLPQYDFVKGEGYFYFGFSDTAPLNTPEPPNSIYTYSLKQCSLEWWEKTIDSQVAEWRETNGEKPTGQDSRIEIE